jgi:flagellin-specific chaperone FliS
MTHSGKKYSGYTVIQPISANSETELKEKIDTYLVKLIEYINEPLVECEYCKGLGFINEIKKIKTNQ